MKELSKEEKAEAMKSKFREELADDGIRCEPEVCVNCPDLIDNSNEYEQEFRCARVIYLYRRSVSDFKDFKIPHECPYKMEHIIIGEQCDNYKTQEEIMEQNDDEIIQYMDFYGMDIDDILDDIEDNPL